MNYQARQKKLLDRLDANRLDALLVTHLPNIRYLCGFTGSSGGRQKIANSWAGGRAQDSL
jgi:hypothetical protein